MSRLVRLGSWCGVAALVVLAARTLAYALAPRPSALSLELERAAGGPRLLLLTVCSLGLGLAGAAAVTGFAFLAVRERLALEPRLVLSPPRLRPLRLVVRSGALFVATSGAFALLESYLHWRAGLGWHGLYCLVGPVHRDALPILAALSLVAVAVLAAVEHLLAWARRTIARLLPHLPSPRPRQLQRRPAPLVAPHGRWTAAALPPRGPPRRLVGCPAANAAARI